jgi:hypothetical protein
MTFFCSCHSRQENPVAGFSSFPHSVS